ncbi:MAG TPA: tetratricopeptide repeat protein [Cyclobacteriaceae bacterium]|nr:tetratricopeptide repeat protein [Cyclobacteriaceae bacterium]
MKLLTSLLFITILCQGQNQIDQAKTLFEAKKYKEAKAILLKVDDDNKDFAAAQYYLGRIAFDEKELDDAEGYLEEAIEANDKVADYHYWLGNVLGTIARDANVVKQGMLASKIKGEYEKTVALDPKNMDAHWGLITFYTEAPGFMGGSFEKALVEAGAIQKLNEADGHRAYGMIYTKQEKFNDAEKEYLLAYKANPAYTNPIVNFYVSRKQNDKAFALLEEAQKNQPENMLIQYQVGRTSAVTGEKLDRGEQCLIKYLSYQPKANEPSHAGAQMRLGQIFEKRGNTAEAKKRYEAAVKLDPAMKEAKDGLARLSK